jgi:colanic acid/amylovoran biosynthesis glycosyltransferase
MKIAIIIPTFPTISETFILDQIVGLLRKGHDVEIFASRKERLSKAHEVIEEYELMEKTHYWFNYSSGKWEIRLRVALRLLRSLSNNPVNTIRALKHLFRNSNGFSNKAFFLTTLFLKKKFDVVFCHFGPSGTQAINIKKIFPDTAFVTMFHGYGTRMQLSKAKEYYRELFSDADLILANSQYTYDRLLEFGSGAEKTKIHPVGININKFVSTPREENATQKELILLSVGRLVQEKGIEYGIRAFSEIVKTCPHKAIRYFIAGDGPLKEPLQQLVSDLHLSDKISFLGFLTQDELIPFYKKADVFVLPSIEEAFGVVLLEAQAMKLPIVASNGGRVRYAVIENESALLVQPGDAEQIAEN